MLQLVCQLIGAAFFGMYLGRIIERHRSNTKVGTPSASHNSESAQFNCRACCAETPMNWIYCPVCGRKLR